MKRFTLVALTCAALLAGCATQSPVPLVPLNTTSGKPEVHIDGVTQEQMMDLLTKTLGRGGQTVQSPDDHTILASQPATFQEEVMIGTKGGQAAVWTEISVKPEVKGVRIRIENRWVQNNNAFGGVQKYPANIFVGPVAQSSQKELEAFKAKVVSGAGLDK